MSESETSMQPDCKYCGGLHYGTPSNECPFWCKHCKRDIRPDSNPRCECEIVCGFGCREVCTGHIARKKDPTVAELQAQLAAKDAVIAEMVVALRSLANEASGFRSMADWTVHGHTNIAVLGLRIDEARAALAAAALPESKACTHTSAYYKEEKPCMICGEKP
jgi:hypothetical protein